MPLKKLEDLLKCVPVVHEVLGDKHTKCLTPQHCKCLCNVCKEAR
jgi:hypothetical protein